MYNKFDDLGIICELFVMLLILYESIIFFQKISNTTKKEQKQEELNLLVVIVLLLFVLYYILKIIKINDNYALVIDTIFIVYCFLIHPIEKKEK